MDPRLVAAGAQQGAAPTATGPPAKFFSLSEVAAHNTEKDCWVIVHDLVYDVSEYLLKHPGGYDLLWKHAGKDCTADFEGMFHSIKARGILQALCIGQVQPSERKGNKGLNPYAARQMAMGASGGAGGTGPYGLGRPAASAAPGVAPFASANNFKVPSAPVSKRTAAPPIAQVIDPVSFRTFKITSMEDISADTKLIRFAIPYDGKLNVPPGKHLIVSTVIDGKMTKREYTPVTDEKGYFELLVKRYPTGPISSFLHNRQIGDQVMMRGLFGTLAWNPDDFVKQNYTKLLLIGAGSGITPLYQIIKAALSTDQLRKIGLVLVYANRTERDILLKDKLEKFQSENSDRLKIRYILSRPESNETESLIGRLDKADILEASLKDYVSKDDKPFAMLCGTDAFTAAVKELLTSSGGAINAIPADQIHIF